MTSDALSTAAEQSDRAVHSNILSARPTDRASLRAWLKRALNLDIPEVALTDGHASPMDYLEHAFLQPPGKPTDILIWAARGAGKTFYAAVATLLDLVFHPTIEVRILGGSLEQSRRMHAHLRDLFSKEPFNTLVDGRITDRRIRLTNGSRAELLAQSHTSVRGARPQKLRCDEVELFHPDIWQAAQLMPRSKTCGGHEIRASIEALSTHHQPHGLMAQLIRESKPIDSSDPPPRTLYRWNAIDVLERCPPARPCDTCSLQLECEGRAKEAFGHIHIDDAIAMKRRTDRSTWESEMLCLKPSKRDLVFPEFDPERHIEHASPSQRPGQLWVAGIDFGFRAPTVILHACLEPDGLLRIVDEYAAKEITLERHIQTLRNAAWPQPLWIGVDPAGGNRNLQTGISDVNILRKHGYSVRHPRAPIEQGLRLIRARLDPAEGPARLAIHPRCAGLIDALQRYRFPGNRPEASEPVKDGADHAVDALRYLLVPLDLSWETTCQRMW